MSSDPTLHDVLIIGAGPAGLALAARLCEHTPSAVFTDDEHSRYHWLRKHQNRMSIKNSKTGRVKLAAADVPAATGPHRPTAGYSTLVLDATTDSWLGRWRKLFGTFEISHLRSPMFFHVDPADRDGLLAYTHDNGKDGELVEIAGCVGREQSKHQRKQKLSGKHKKFRGEVTVNEREREDYFTPSQRLFASHCECVIDRYGLREGLVRQEGVLDIRYADVPHINEDEPVFTIKTDQGQHFARTVVLAVGPGNAPCIPGVKPGQAPLPRCCHSMQIQRFPDPSVAVAVKQGRKTNVLVVGGGLTSAQLSDMAVRHGVTKVWHLMRGECKVKPFDVDLPWMGKFRNLEQAIFWSADSDTERLEQIKSARGGGSMTPAFHKILKAHIAKGRLSLHTHTTISSKEFDTAAKTWRIATEPPIPDLPPIDYIYYATGIQTDFTTLPFLQTMLREHPIHGHGGLPCLNDDLMWKDGVPLFVTGRLASLRLGPGAGNLGGARIGAERIAWSLMDHLGNGSAGGHSSDSGHEELLEYASARGNRYANLTVSE